MCPACLCCLTRRTDLATGPDEIRVSATNHLNAIINRYGSNGIVRSAVTLRVWLSVIITFGTSATRLIFTNKRAKLWTELDHLFCAGRRDRHESGGARRKGRLAALIRHLSSGQCHQSLCY